ncbi:MAG: DUF2029 domain-containing protein [Planctomycetes bacterium]|nr:DUF2029 domain-containing protein [Planctomycetota bacterium]
MRRSLPWASIGAAAAAAILAVLVVKGIRNALSPSGSDFVIYRAAALRALRGESIYAGGVFMYPPFFAVAFIPLAVLPIGWGAALWGIGKAAALLVALRASLDLFDLRGRIRVAAGAAALAGTLRFLDSDFTNGNANALIASCLVWCIVEAAKGRRIRAGFIWSAAVAVKVTPILLLPWVLRRGGWKMPAGGAGGLVLWLVVIPAAAISPSGAGSACRAWYDITLAQFNPADEAFSEGERGSDYQPGQSLRALLHRSLRPIDASAHDRRVIRVNVADLPKATVEVIAYAVAALLFLAWLCTGRRAGAGGDAALALAWMVLASPYSRKAHFVALLLPAVYLAARGLRDGRRAAWIGAGAGAAVLAASPGIVGKRAATLLLAHSMIGWAGLACFIAVALCARTPEGEPPSSAEARVAAQPH